MKGLTQAGNATCQGCPRLPESHRELIQGSLLHCGPVITLIGWQEHQQRAQSQELPRRCWIISAGISWESLTWHGAKVTLHAGLPRMVWHRYCKWSRLHTVCSCRGVLHMISFLQIGANSEMSYTQYLCQSLSHKYSNVRGKRVTVRLHLRLFQSFSNLRSNSWPWPLRCWCSRSGRGPWVLHF